MMSKLQIGLTVNDTAYLLSVQAHHTLLDVLRDDLQLTGTNEGCRMGDCGACTVLLDNRRVPSCLVLAASAHGKTVLTIEGLAAYSGWTGGDAHPTLADRDTHAPQGVGLARHVMQEAFVRHGALQCGFCTPGMILSAVALLQENPQRPLSERAVRQGLTGNLCRCTGYPKIVAAILEVANG